jgi:hypothetical protein
VLKVGADGLADLTSAVGRSQAAIAAATATSVIADITTTASGQVPTAAGVAKPSADWVRVENRAVELYSTCGGCYRRLPMAVFSFLAPNKMMANGAGAKSSVATRPGV